MPSPRRGVPGPVPLPHARRAVSRGRLHRPDGPRVPRGRRRGPARRTGRGVSAALALARREIVRFFRQKSRVVGAVAPPLVMWLLVGSGFKGSFRERLLRLLLPGHSRPRRALRRDLRDDLGHRGPPRGFPAGRSRRARRACLDRARQGRSAAPCSGLLQGLPLLVLVPVAGLSADAARPARGRRASSSSSRSRSRRSASRSRGPSSRPRASTRS